MSNYLVPTIICLLLAINSISFAVNAEGINNSMSILESNTFESSNMISTLELTDSGILMDENETWNSIQSSISRGGIIELILPEINITAYLSPSLTPLTPSCDLNVPDTIFIYSLKHSTGMMIGSLLLLDTGNGFHYDFYLVGNDPSRTSNSIDIGFQYHSTNNLSQLSNETVRYLGYFRTPIGDWQAQLFSPADNINGILTQFSYPLYRIRVVYGNEDPLFICKELAKADVIARGELGVALGISSFSKNVTFFSSFVESKYVASESINCSNSLTAIFSNAQPQSMNPYPFFSMEVDVDAYFFHPLDFVNNTVYSHFVNPEPGKISLGCGWYNGGVGTTANKAIWTVPTEYYSSRIIDSSEIYGWHAQVLLHELMHTMKVTHSMGVKGDFHVYTGSNSPNCSTNESITDSEVYGYGTPPVNGFSSLMADRAGDYYCWGHVPFVNTANQYPVQSRIESPYMLLEPNRIYQNSWPVNQHYPNFLEGIFILPNLKNNSVILPHEIIGALWFNNNITLSINWTIGVKVFLLNQNNSTILTSATNLPIVKHLAQPCCLINQTILGSGDILYSYSNNWPDLFQYSIMSYNTHQPVVVFNPPLPIFQNTIVATNISISPIQNQYGYLLQTYIKPDSGFIHYGPKLYVTL